MAETFAVGEEVQLKSGGPSMMVEEIDGAYVSCVWYEGKKVHRDKFVAATLRKYESSAGFVPLVRG